MALLVHIANVSDDEAVAIQSEMNPVFELFGILKIIATWSRKEPIIEVDLEESIMAVKGKAIIFVFGYTGKQKNKLGIALRTATGIEVLVV